MDQDKIFILFDEIEDEMPNDEDLSLYDKIIIFQEILANFKAIFSKLERLLREKDKEHVIEETGELYAITYYYKAWSYLSDFDVTNKKDIEVLRQFKGDLGLVDDLNISIQYFESQENYEICGEILKILNKLKGFRK